jgi:cellulose synthase/poly-beta-1,6-N-acetylglucosamine synthase-like glycosyltransferase
MIDVIVPTKNSESTLEVCLKSLRQQTIPVRIIIVDGCSTDKTLEIAKKYNCEIYDEPKSLVQGSKRAVACNQGLKHVTSDLVAFLDSDTEVPTTWANDMEQAFSNINEFGQLNVVGISSGCIPDTSSDLSTSINNVMKLASNHAQEYNDFTYVNSLPGYNSVYRIKALIEVGGFNEEIGGAEDWEMNYRLRMKGYKLLGISDSPVIHHERKTIKQFQKQMEGYGWSWGRMLRVKHFYLPSRSFPSLIILLSPVIAFLPYFIGTRSLIECTVFFMACWGFIYMVMKIDFKNKYYTLLRVTTILGFYFGIGYIKAIIQDS